MLERRDLEIFLTLAEELHFGRTAERLRVSTARVSQTIRKMERRIGVPLFERTSRKVALTPIGRQLEADVRPAYRRIEEGIRRAVAAGRDVGGVLRVGFFGAPAGQFVLEAADAFRVRHPDCEVQIRESHFDDGLTDKLRAGEIDLLLAVLPYDAPDLTASPVLVREGCVLAVSARHPLARRAAVSLDDLDPARDRVLRAPATITDYWGEVLAPHRTGEPLGLGPEFATVQEMLALVGAGKGVYIFPERGSRYYTRPDVAFVPVADAPPFEWVFLWRTAGQTHRVRAFSQAAHDLAAARGHLLADA